MGGERNEAAELGQENLVSECPQQLWGGFGLIISPSLRHLLSLDTGGCQEALLGFSFLPSWSFQLLWECLKWNKVELCQLCPLTWK